MSGILVVEDDENLNRGITFSLKKSGYEVFSAESVKKAKRIASDNNVDVTICDVNLPDGNGLEFVRWMRCNYNTYIICLTALDQEMDQVMGYEAGADDYITKPFRPLVLGAKVKALIRRTKNMGNHSDIIQCGPFSYESSTMRFYKDGEELILSSKESALLLLFIKHPGQVYTKDMIYEQVWGTTVAIDDNAIMVYINRLRSKIEKDRQKPEHIITVRGMGYRFLP